MPNLQLPPVSKEIAIRLKEKGFDLLVTAMYLEEHDRLIEDGRKINFNDIGNCISAPSLDLALLWLEGKGFKFLVDWNWNSKNNENDYTLTVIKNNPHNVERQIQHIYNSTAFKESQVVMALDIMDSEK